MPSRLTSAIKAILVVQIVQWPFFVGGGIPHGPVFLAFHAGLVALLLFPLAWLRTPDGPTRRQALAYLCLPVVLSMWPESVDAVLNTWIALTAVAGATGAVLLGHRLRWLGDPDPVAFAGAGAAAGAGLMALRYGAGVGRVALGALLALSLFSLAWAREHHIVRRVARRAVPIAGLVLLSWLVPTLGGWRPPAPPPGDASEAAPTVLIVLDAVRADHLSMYGHHRNTMPSLEELGRSEGFRSRRAVANAALSLPTHASIFTGVVPPRHGAHLPFVDDPNPSETYLYRLPENGPSTLAERFSDAGYWTVALSGNYTHLHPEMGLSRGFHVYRAVPSPGADLRRRTPWCQATALGWYLAGRDRTGPCRPFQEDVPYRGAAEITDEAIATIDAAGDRPFFLFLNYFDAHNPFLAPPPWAGSYPGELDWNHARRVDDRFREGGAADLTPAERAHASAAYDAELRYIDSQLDRLLERLRAHPRWEDLLLVITSDHGMSLGDHGLVGHEAQLFDAEVRVPLIVKPGRHGPERPTDGVDGELRQSVDLFPLLLRNGGIRSAEDLDGRPWDEGRDTARAWLFVDEKLARRDPGRYRRQLRMAERDGWKLIESSRGRRWAFDLVADPLESTVLPLSPARAAALRAALGEWPRFESSRRQDVRADADVMRQLRSLGYLQ